MARKQNASPLTRGRGSKLRPLCPDAVRVRRPSRGGVDRNHDHDVARDQDIASPLTRGRGSKHAILRYRGASAVVAPHAGAWIETTITRSARRRATCRPSRGGVDRNEPLTTIRSTLPVAPHAGAWIETVIVSCPQDQQRVAPHAGAWIETRQRTTDGAAVDVAPHAGAWIETTWVSRCRCWNGCRPSRGGADRNSSGSSA